jgi:cytochrome c biogenesis protein CcmG, thiol:disulfide interchange protein DsbE
MTSVTSSAEVPRRRNGRLVLWISLSVAVVLAVLIAVLASSSSAGQGVSSPLVGKPAPAISGTALGGSGQVSLAQFKGQWVLVNFAASWCIPCHEEMPQLKLFAQQHQSPPTAVIVTVADDESDVGSLRSYLRSAGATWPSVDDGQAVVDYGVGQIPESYLVDPSGRVVAKYFGGVVAATLDAFITQAAAR